MKRITANQFQTSERYYKLPKVLFEDYAKKYGHENFTMRNWADFQYYKDKTLDTGQILNTIRIRRWIW